MVNISLGQPFKKGHTYPTKKYLKFDFSGLSYRKKKVFFFYCRTSIFIKKYYMHYSQQAPKILPFSDETFVTCFFLNRLKKNQILRVF